MSLLTIYSIGVMYNILMIIIDYDHLIELSKKYSNISIHVVTSLILIAWPIGFIFTFINSIYKVLLKLIKKNEETIK